MTALKKTLIIPINDREIAVDVDFRVVEIVERTFDLSADAVIALMADERRVQRNKVADVIVGWLAFRDLGMKRSEIRAYVMTSPPELLSIYVANIYGALLFVLNYFDRKDPAENARKFDELVSSDQWPKIPGAEDGEGKKKPKPTRRSSATATELQ